MKQNYDLKIFSENYFLLYNWENKEKQEKSLTQKVKINFNFRKRVNMPVKQFINIMSL